MSAQDITYAGPEYGQTCECGIDPVTTTRSGGYLHYVRCCATCEAECAASEYRQGQEALAASAANGYGIKGRSAAWA